MITHSFTKCPRCKATLRPATSWAGTPSEFYLECPNCNTYVDTYIPMEHQWAVHRSNSLYTGNFGGYGTGKTYTSRKEVIKHALLTPGGLIVVGAKVSSQYEQTLKKELEQDIPAAWVKSYSTQKSTMTLFNGCVIIYRPFEDPDTLRSYNATMFVILEASEVKYEAFSQLQTRLRNRRAGTPLLDTEGNQVVKEEINPATNRKVKVPQFVADWRKGIIESNPDAGWIRTNFVLQSRDIEYFGSVIDSDLLERQSTKHPNIESFIAATDVNTFLPATFYTDVSTGKPEWWVNKFLHGSFAYSEGLVYPRSGFMFIPPFEIPLHWKRLLAHDYGIQDPSVFLCGAIDEDRNRVVLYKELRTTNKDIKALAQMYFEATVDIPQGGMYTTPIIDPKSGAKRDYHLRSLKDLYLEEGILFDDGVIPVDVRIYRLNTYIENKSIVAFDTLTELQREFENYKFPDRNLDNKKREDKPVDKDNHGINCAEWIVCALPQDPADIQKIRAFSSHGALTGLTTGQRQEYYDPLNDYSTQEDSELAYGMDDYTQVF